MATIDPSSTSILIVGCGTWGSSTALHLARRGYKNVTVLDPYEVPSAISAGNDVNKIVEQGLLCNCHNRGRDARLTFAQATEARTHPSVIV